MQVFLTGGTGFIGANLARLLLEQGYRVKALVRASSRLDNLQDLLQNQPGNLEIVTADLLDPDLWQAMRGCEALFHVAAHYSLWQADRYLLYCNNVEGTHRVLAAARQAGIQRTVYTSSVAAIGASSDRTGQNSKPVDETHQSPVENLIGDYKKSKYWAEQAAMQAVQAGQDIVIVNPTSPIGAGDIKPTPTGDIIRRFLRRQMPFYLDTGLNFVHVRDVAWGHLRALTDGKTGERYILGHENLTLKAFLDLLDHLTGLPAPQTAIPAWLPYCIAWIDENLLAKFGKTPSVPLDGVRMAKQYMFYDSSKAIRELQLPQTPILEALTEAVDWFVAREG